MKIKWDVIQGNQNAKGKQGEKMCDVGDELRDVDFVATRGNSGNFDGVFWLEQVRTKEPVRSFEPARASESVQLPLPRAER